MTEPTASGIRSREQLIDALTIAAELEHNLCCAYLFAAFSIKTSLVQFDPDSATDQDALVRAEVRREQARGWKTTLLLVARQEMEHLAVVSNLLTAVGGPQHFRRPNFPQQKSYYTGPDQAEHGLEMTLERFGVVTMERFVRVERPANLSPDDPGRYTSDDPAARVDTDQLVARPFEFSIDLVQTLYTAIRDGLIWLDSNGPGPLFIGPPDAQVDGPDVQIGFGNREFGFTLNKVANLDDALAAVDVVIEQGEGVVLDHRSGEVLADSHYARFQAVLDDIAHLDWDPAHQVVPNPALFLFPETQSNRDEVTIVTHPATREVMELFDASYQVMISMLTRFFGHGDDTDNERHVLLRTAFFPLMTLVVRPVGEILCEMPAFVDEPHGARAGPGFGLSADADFLPNRTSAWHYLAERLDAIAEHADASRLAWPGLDYVADSLGRVARNFRSGMLDTTEAG